MSPPIPLKPLHVRIRFITSGVLQLFFIYYFTHAGAVGGADKLADLKNEFLFIAVPTVAILFLLPVLFKGSFQQKTLTFVLLLFPIWCAYGSWSDFFTNHFFNQ